MKFIPILLITIAFFGSKTQAQKFDKIDQLLFSEQYEQAIPLLQKKVDQNNQDYKNYYRLGKAYQNIKANDKALETFEKANQLQPESNNYLFSYSAALFNSGNYDKAKEKTLDFLERKPDHFRASLMLAKIYSIQNNYSKGIEIYNQLLAKDSLNYYLHKQSGSLKYKMDNYIGALASYLKANEINEKDLAVYVKIIQIMFEMGGYQDALVYANKGLAIYPENPSLLRKKAKVLMGLKWYENAMNIYEDLQEKKQLRASDYKSLGICYMQCKKYQKAIEYFNLISIKTGADTDKDPMINFYKGVCSIRLHKTKEAIELLEKAVFYITPQIKGDMHLQLAKAYKTNKEFKKAVEQYKKSYEIDSKNFQILYDIASTYEEYNSKTKNALTYYTKYLQKCEEKEGKRYEYAKSRILHLKEKIHFEK